MSRNFKSDRLLGMLPLLLLGGDQTPQTDTADGSDGTVYVASQNLTWAKCSQVDVAGANMYNSGSNDCSGDSAGTFQYCSGDDSSCDDRTILNGTGTSGVWSTCASLTLAGRTWRVPTSDELSAFYTVYSANTATFPGTVADAYWSSSTHFIITSFAWCVDFGSAFVGNTYKTSIYYVRCVATGP